MRTIPGFDYRLHKEVQLTRPQWREMLWKLTQAGGWRKAEGGETFGYSVSARGAELAFEIYDNV